MLLDVKIQALLVDIRFYTKESNGEKGEIFNPKDIITPIINQCRTVSSLVFYYLFLTVFTSDSQTGFRSLLVQSRSICSLNTLN